jgi:hypothetical protein
MNKDLLILCAFVMFGVLVTLALFFITHEFELGG